MKKTVNIRFFLEILLLVVTLVLLIFSVMGLRTSRQNKAVDPESPLTRQEADSGKENDEIEETLAKDALYLLKLEQDRVVIYHAADGEIYDQTDITVEDLPEEVCLELQQGIPVYSMKELYDFLENYSS